MKKYLFAILILIFSGFIFIFFLNKDFVSIEENEFVLGGEKFYPVTLNYLVQIHSDGNDFWVRPSGAYLSENNLSKKEFLARFEADMDSIKSMGFNSVRLIKIGEVTIDDTKEGELSFRASLNQDKDTTIMLTGNDAGYQLYFEIVEEMFHIMDKVGLKAILLMPMSVEYETTKDHLKRMAAHFKNNTTIMAYDLFNEPLYFDLTQRSKESVFHEVNLWDSIFNANDKNHLTTIGLEGIREVFEWDPNILNVDFISYHPYEYEPEQVRNEIYWYGKYTYKPWTLGETAIPANDDSITYKEQKLFAAKTLQQTINCGGIGYSWWQFMDVEWYKYHANFMGVVTRENKQKPVTEVFKNFTLSKQKDSCLCLNNYYNYSESTDFRIIGKMLDEKNNPIVGGVILGWREDWGHSYHTITKEDGSFELLGSYPFYHWMASATEYSMVRGELLPDSAQVDSTDMPTINLGNLTLNKLTFLKPPDDK